MANPFFCERKELHAKAQKEKIKTQSLLGSQTKSFATYLPGLK